MTDIARLVDILAEGRRAGREPIEVAGITDLDFPTALKVQAAVLKRLTASDESLGGWKVGMTSGNSRDNMGKDFRPFGYVLKSHVFKSNDHAPLAKILRCQIEPELCLILGAPLRGDVTAAQAKAAVRGIAPAFEINEIRVPSSWHRPLMLADGLAQWGVVVGAEVPVRDGLANTTVAFYRDTEKLDEVTPGPTMDDPFLSLARLAKLLDAHGFGLEPGQPVITGAFCKAVVTPGTYRATFSDVGEVSFRFT